MTLKHMAIMSVITAVVFSLIFLNMSESIKEHETQVNERAEFISTRVNGSELEALITKAENQHLGILVVQNDTPAEVLNFGFKFEKDNKGTLNTYEIFQGDKNEPFPFEVFGDTTIHEAKQNLTKLKEALQRNKDDYSPTFDFEPEGLYLTTEAKLTDTFVESGEISEFSRYLTLPIVDKESKEIVGVYVEEFWTPLTTAPLAYKMYSHQHLDSLRDYPISDTGE